MAFHDLLLVSLETSTSFRNHHKSHSVCQSETKLFRLFTLAALPLPCELTSGLLVLREGRVSSDLRNLGAPSSLWRAARLLLSSGTKKKRPYYHISTSIGSIRLLWDCSNDHDRGQSTSGAIQSAVVEFTFLSPESFMRQQLEYAQFERKSWFETQF